MPILQMKNTSLLALSSPEGSSNYYSKLINLKDEKTDEPFFRVENCYMICEDCRKLPEEEQIDCNHIKQPAHWLNQKKTARFMRVYRETDPATALKEYGGVIADDFKPCFRKDSIDALYSAPRVFADSAVGTIYITADPCGGGPSQLAIVSGYYTDSDCFVITGLDSESVRHAEEVANVIHAHIRQLNRNPQYRAARKIFIPENNLGLEASHMDTMVRQFNDVTTYWENPNKRPGVCMTAQSKQNYVYITDLKLRLGLIRFAHDLFTVSSGKRPRDQLGLLREQLEMYHKEVLDASKSSVRGYGKIVITGKSNGKQDDLCIAFQMAIYWPHVIRSAARR